MTTKSFHAAVVDAINRGDDADTVGAVAGMIAGRIYGISQENIINGLQLKEQLLKTLQKIIGSD
jgi:ADP-ribosyl-[dinitrogen reductase] hydrolase